MAQEEFTWRDGERTIVFKEEALAEVVESLRWHGWDRYELLTTQRALNDAPLQLPVEPRPVLRRLRFRRRLLITPSVSWTRGR